MKKLLFIITLFSAQILNAQNKLITLEDIWSKGTFKQEYVRGFNSMNAGLHYSALGKDEDGTYISKFAFKNQNEICRPVELNSGHISPWQHFNRPTKSNKIHALCK